MPTVELEFFRKYDAQHACEYLERHQDGLARRVSALRALCHELRRHSSLGSLEWGGLNYGYQCSSDTESRR